MTNPTEVQRPQLPKALASWDEGSAVCAPKNDIATTWFVPPIVVPAPWRRCFGPGGVSGVFLIDIPVTRDCGRGRWV